MNARRLLLAVLCLGLVLAAPTAVGAQGAALAVGADGVYVVNGDTVYLLAADTLAVLASIRLPGPRGTDGPWSHRVLLATSTDGQTFKLGDTALSEQASVPELFLGPDDQPIVLFVDGQTTRLGALVRLADGTWQRRPTNLVGVDPNVLRLGPRSYRAYVKVDRQGAFDAWESADGLNWTRLREVFRDSWFPLATDPDVFQTKDGWVMLISVGPRLLRCTSPDGLDFTAADFVDLGGSVSDTVAVDGGWRTFFHVNADPGRGTRLTIRSAFTTDGLNWRVEPGDRVTPPATGPAARGVGDPAALRLPDGTWLMAIKSFMD